MAAVVMQRPFFVFYGEPCSGEFHRRASGEPAAAQAQGFGAQAAARSAAEGPGEHPLRL